MWSPLKNVGTFFICIRKNYFEITLSLHFDGVECESYGGVALSVARSSKATEAIVGALRRLKVRAQPRPFTREPNTNPVF